MSLASGDLTTLYDVQQYATSPATATVLSGLISRLSRMILTTLNRPLLVPKSYTEQFDGSGTQQLVLPNFPVINVPTVTISGCTIQVAPQVSDTVTASSPFGFRYQLWNGIPPGNPAVLQTTGGAFFYGGKQNVVVNYSAGYQISGEAATVPGTGPYTYTPLTPYGIWATDQGITYAATGIALTAIASGTPSTGQYIPPNPNNGAPSAPNPINNYTFAAGDAGAALLINYGFIPADVEQACIDLILERASYRGRIGLRSQALAGQETLNYDVSGLTAFIKRELADYVCVIPPNIGALV